MREFLNSLDLFEAYVYYINQIIKIVVICKTKMLYLELSK